MPELPEVETVVRGVRPGVVGRAITGAQVHWAGSVATPLPETFAARLTGQRIEKVWRRAKFIVADLSDDVLLIHLRMTGRLYVASSAAELEADRWLRVAIDLDNGNELRFSDMRKFGRVYLVSDVSEITGTLGPEPLDEDFSLDLFRDRIKTRGSMIKPLLLDQSFVAGIGNIYADEALWLARIHPRRTADTLTEDEVAQLHDSIRSVLRDGIRREGASINWYRKPDGSKGSQQTHLYAYGREGEPCSRCGTPIIKTRLAQRGTHYCPVCQTEEQVQ